MPARSVALLFSFCLFASSARASEPAPDALRALIGRSAYDAQASTPCQGKWTNRAARGGSRFRIMSCPNTSIQLYLHAGRVFAVGAPLILKTTLDRAALIERGRRASLERSCTEMRTSARAWIGQCGDELAALLVREPEEGARQLVIILGQPEPLAELLKIELARVPQGEQGAPKRSPRP